MLGQEVGGNIWQVSPGGGKAPRHERGGCLSSHPRKVLLGSGTLKSGHFQATACIPICKKLNILCKHPQAGLSTSHNLHFKPEVKRCKQKISGKSEKYRAFRATPGLWRLPSVWPWEKPEEAAQSAYLIRWPGTPDLHQHVPQLGAQRRLLQRSRRW